MLQDFLDIKQLPSDYEKETEELEKHIDHVFSILNNYEEENEKFSAGQAIILFSLFPIKSRFDENENCWDSGEEILAIIIESKEWPHVNLFTDLELTQKAVEAINDSFCKSVIRKTSKLNPVVFNYAYLIFSIVDNAKSSNSPKINSIIPELIESAKNLSDRDKRLLVMLTYRLVVLDDKEQELIGFNQEVKSILRNILSTSYQFDNEISDLEKRMLSFLNS